MPKYQHMEALFKQRNHRMIYSASAGIIGLCALGSTFAKDAISHPAQVVFISTALCMWALLFVVFSQFCERTSSRFITTILSGVTVVALLESAIGESIGAIASIAIFCSAIATLTVAVQPETRAAYISLALNILFLMIGLHFSEILSNQPLVSMLIVTLLSASFFLVRNIHIPVVNALRDATERADIFSTITKSSREFHSREPEEAIRNIVNVTKTLGYISVSVVSFDRRQKIFEDGVPIPNVMDVAVRASATRRVTITEDEHRTKSRNNRQGDIVGVPIWINGRYSAALIVQTSPHTKVSQRDCEALELLADQAGRALENAGKAAMDRRVVERLTDESQRDKLTGLGNRRFADAMVASMKPGDVLAMIDLDGLKKANDVFGHASGDELLHQVGVFLAEQIRNPDTAARLGGDEFMILLRNAGDGAPKILERLLVLWGEKKLYDTTFSIGMAVHRHDKTPRETVEAADEALYSAKKAGKNRLVCANAA